MSDLENSRAHAEALGGSETRALRSARRAHLWAGLNRYLGSEVQHARKVAAEEKKADREAGPAPGRRAAD